jgi:hypothetical protein
MMIKRGSEKCEKKNYETCQRRELLYKLQENRLRSRQSQFTNRMQVDEVNTPKTVLEKGALERERRNEVGKDMRAISGLM